MPSQLAPYLTKYNDSTGYDGFIRELLDEVGKLTGVAFTLQTNTEFGKLVNGTWTGLVGDVTSRVSVQFGKVVHMDRTGRGRRLQGECSLQPGGPHGPDWSGTLPVGLVLDRTGRGCHHQGECSILKCSPLGPDWSEMSFLR